MQPHPVSLSPVLGPIKRCSTLCQILHAEGLFLLPYCCCRSKISAQGLRRLLSGPDITFQLRLPIICNLWLLNSSFIPFMGWRCVLSKFTCWSPSFQSHRTWLYFEIRSLKEIFKIRQLKEVLIQSDWCPLWRILGCTEGYQGCMWTSERPYKDRAKW